MARRNRHGMAQVGVLVVQLDQCRVFGKWTAMGPHVSSDDTEGRQLRIGAWYALQAVERERAVAGESVTVWVVNSERLFFLLFPIE